MTELRGGRLMRLPGSMRIGRVALEGVIASHPRTDSVRVRVATQPVDMRKGFDGLAAVVRSFLTYDPILGCTFVFRNRLVRWVRILSWACDGLAIHDRRLECGAIRFPNGDDKVMAIDGGQLLRLLSGMMV